MTLTLAKAPLWAVARLIEQLPGQRLVPLATIACGAALISPVAYFRGWGRLLGNLECLLAGVYT